MINFYYSDGIPNPHIIEEPKSKMVLLGSNVTLQCRANSSSDEKIAFRWKRDNIEVKSSLGMYIKYNFRISSDSKEQTSELHIYNASLRDAGIYQCFTSNSYGSAHSGKANVSVVGMCYSCDFEISIVTISVFNEIFFLFQFFQSLPKFLKTYK